MSDDPRAPTTTATATPTLADLRRAWASSHPAARAHVISELRQAQLRWHQSALLDVLHSEDRQERLSGSMMGAIAGAFGDNTVDRELSNLLAVAASLLEATIDER